MEVKLSPFNATINALAKNDEHCAKGALTGIFGWLLQFILATLAFTCLVGKYLVLYIFYSRNI